MFTLIDSLGITCYIKGGGFHWHHRLYQGLWKSVNWFKRWKRRNVGTYEQRGNVIRFFCP